MTDILFIVPERTLALHSKIIKTVLWAVKNESSYTVMGADVFVDIYGNLPVEEAAEKLRIAYAGVCNLGTLSKREQKAYEMASKPIFDHLGIEAP